MTEDVLIDTMCMMATLNDLQIRKAFKANFYFENKVNLVDEIDLSRGKARIDLICTKDFVTGYEIKSDVDSLARLGSQAETYNRSLEKIVVLSGTKHVDLLMDLLPSWWGLVSVKLKEGEICFSEIRAPKLNPHFDHCSLLDLLWKDELISILKNYGVSKVGSKSKYELKSIIQMIAPYFELKPQVLKLLELRTHLLPV